MNPNKHIIYILLVILLGCAAPGKNDRGADLALALNYSNIGAAQHQKGDYDKALEYFHKALTIRINQLGPEHPDVAISNNNIGAAHNGKGDNAKALEIFQKSLAVWIKKLGPNHSNIGTSYINIGLAHRSIGNLDQALEVFKKFIVFQTRKTGSDHADIATCQIEIGNIYAAKGKYNLALEAYQNSLSIRRKLLGPTHPEVAECFNNIGVIYEKLAEYSKSLAAHEKALKIDLEILGPDHPKVAVDFSNIGVMYLTMGEHAHSLEFHQKALAIELKNQGEDHLGVASSYNNIGAVYEVTGRYNDALESFQKSMAIRIKQIGRDDPEVAATINNIATIYSALGEYRKALELYHQSLEIRRKILGDGHPDVANSYNNIGTLQNIFGEHGKALELFQKALAIWNKKLGASHPYVAAAYNNIGDTYSFKSEHQKALEFFKKAIVIWKKQPGAGNPSVATSYAAIGRVYNAMGKHEHASEYHQKSLGIRLELLGADHPDVAGNYNSMGLGHIVNGEYEKALELHGKALGIGLKKLGSSHPILTSSYNGIGLAHLGLKDSVSALAVARKAQGIEATRLAYILTFTSELQRMNYQRSRYPYFIMGTLGSATDLAKAILHNKGIVLSSIMEDQLAAQASSDPKIKELVSQLLGASQHLNKLEMENPKDTSEKGWLAHRNKQEAARERAGKLQQALARNVGGLGQARASLSLTVKDVQAKLPEDAVLLEYIVYNHYQGKGQIEERYGVIMLPKEGEPKWGPLGSVEPIAKLLPQYSPMKPTSDEAYEKVLRGLYDKLMAPIVKQLPKDTKTLILCPDGPLNFLSFATLLTDKDRFLCEDYTIKYVSSGRDLVPGKQINQPKGNLLVFANPTYDETPVQLARANGVALTLRSLDRDELRGGLKFKALPGTQKEADYLGDKARDWKLKSEIYVGKQATEAAISGVQSPRILHLATHGFFLTEEKAKDDPRGIRLMVGLGIEQQKSRGPIRNPMHRSGLALAGAQKTLDAWKKGETPPTENDGILTAAEVSVLDLKGTWLVTLSACETGQGEARSGEGVLGLRRAFIQAGAQNLLMTLWPVSDKYTVPFMMKFYERAIRSKDAPTTMAEVQKELLIESRKKYGTKLAVQLYGPFILSFQGD